MTEDETRARLLDAAAKIFAAKGYSGATTRAIATAAGVNEVTLFRHFGSKKTLYEEMVRRNSAVPGLQSALQEQMTGDYTQDLRLICIQFLTLMLERRQEILSSLFEAENRPEMRPLIASIPDRQRQLLGGYIRSHFERGDVRAVDPEMAAQSLLGTFLAYSISQSLLPETMTKQTPEEVVDHFLDVFVNGTLKR
jgi:AcrR family transcriptional regulator